MNINTISGERTIGGGQTGTLLAGRYRVVRQLGRGGMGSVWLAEDTALDNHPVAVKMLPAVLVADRRAFRQLKDEALVSMRLVHPNVVQVRSFEENGGNPFLVSDYVDGRTLDDVLAERGRLPEEEALRLLAPVAAALDYAHRAGVVHRDVKPANVMVRRDGTPFVLDFGIAREVQETLTRVTGRLSSGTLLYMSPEQLRGAEARPAQDVYSFAATAYECLSGSPPFTRGQVEFQILNEPPPPLVPEAPLARAVLRGLAKRPEDRPPTCAGVLSPAPPSASDRTPQQPSAGPSDPPRPRAPSARPQPPKMPLPPSKRPFWSVQALRHPLIACTLIGLGLIGILWWTSGPSRPQGTVLPSSDPAALDKAVRAKTDAEMGIAYIKRLSHGEGLHKYFVQVVEEKKLADNYYQKACYSQAIDGYRTVQGICEKLQELDKERGRAGTARETAEKERKTAGACEALQHAGAKWHEGEVASERARRAYDGGDFAAAVKDWTSAATHYRNAAREARDEKNAAARRLAEEEKDRARRANWRLAGRDFVLRECGLDLTMIWCPAGTFSMGAQGQIGTQNASVHKVTLTKGFWLGETEVTQGQWRKLMGTGLHDQARKALSSDVLFPQQNGEKKTLRQFWNRSRDADPADLCGDVDDNVPIYYVNWEEACEFCNRLTTAERHAGRLPDGYEYRLPTEAEWEYACRAGVSGYRLPNGEVPVEFTENNVPMLHALGWYFGNSAHGFNGRGWSFSLEKDDRPFPGRAAPRTVKGRAPNRWGFYDMLGNLEEWCADGWAVSWSNTTDPLAVSRGVRIARGGAWRYPGKSCMPWARSGYHPLSRSNVGGFRVALAKTQTSYPYTEDLPALKADVASAADLAAEQKRRAADAKEKDSGLYIVKVGDTFAGIAHAHGMTVDELKRLNGNMEPGVLLAGQALKISTTQGSMMRKPQEERYAIEIYMVKSGDSLGKIAYEHGMTIRELKELNGGLTDLGTFRVGTILQVKAKQGSTVRRKTDDLNELLKDLDRSKQRYVIEIYTVKVGDTFAGIASAHGMTIEELKELNGLTDLGTLRVGTILQVRAGQGSAVRRTTETSVPVEWQLRPAWMNFCRYCRHPFTGAYIPKKCPNCGKYVLGD